MVGRGSTGIGEKGSVPCLAGEQDGNLIIRKERDLKKSIPLARKIHVISPMSTSSYSCYPLFFIAIPSRCVYFLRTNIPLPFPKKNEFAKEL